MSPSPNKITIMGIDKEVVGDTAREDPAEVRPPEPYKGKGLNTKVNISGAKLARLGNSLSG